MSTQEKYSFLCCETLTDILIYDYYGYWHERIELPEWVNDKSREKVKFLIDNLKPSNLTLSYTTNTDNPYCGKIYSCDYIIEDINNPHIEPYISSVCGCATKKGAESYAISRFHTLKRLYDGDVEALLYYKKTGIPCLPNWNTNKSSDYGYKNGEKNRVPRLHELEGKKS